MTCLESDILYMDIAHRISLESKAIRNKVGAVLVQNSNIISFGWNGTPTGFSNICENENGETFPYVLHAEENVLTKLIKNGSTTTIGSTLYITLSPCFNCAKLILQAGICRVVYHTLYRDAEPLNFLKNVNIVVDQII